MWLLPCGIIIHLIFFMSVFDIYFRTPIIHGMLPESIDCHPAAERVVLFVADGLRADSLFTLTNDTTRAPYLRKVMETRGTWGVSHTRVPSESRPGHVSIIGGIYEDPSAITLGWKENPVEFDSVFNQSRHTWSWGSPDILPMFAAGSEKGHIDTFMYDSKLIDFASNDASQLDTWVFTHVEEFFLGAKEDKPLMDMLKKDRNIYFLHLLGLDTNGHSHKPYSDEYLSNIEIVDKGVAKTVKLFEDFFKDNGTAFIFTADHGMTDWGSHGAGDPSETETPIVAWGAGISLPEDPLNFQEKMLYDSRMETWGLNHVRRHDVFQADLAPLMAMLIGVPIPVNSVGTLPVEYLYPNETYRAKAIFTNAKQMLAHYRQRHKERAQNTLPMIFKPFPELLPDAELDSLRNIKDYIRRENFDQAIQQSNKLIYLSLNGITYYLNYDRRPLTLAVSLGFIGWIFLLFCKILNDHTQITSIAANTVEGRRIRKKNFFFGACLICIALLTLFFLVAQNAPWQHYFYFMTPVFLWGVFFFRMEAVKYAWLVVTSFNMVWEIAIRFLVIALGIEILVFSFFVRPLLSVGLIFVGFWPFILHNLQGTTEKSLRLCWIGACILLASFTYMPVVGQHPSYTMVEIGGLLSFALLAVSLFWCGGESWALRTLPPVVYVQGGMILASVYLVHSTTFSINMKDGLPPGNQLAAWLILVSSLVLPLFGSRFVMGRLVAVTSSLLCPFILLSIRHEVFFYIALSVAMFLWLTFEYYLSGDRIQIAALKFSLWRNLTQNERQRNLIWPDIRMAFFFLFFVILAFFGTGNIASVNSFDPNFIYCFVTVYSPFVMGGLLLLKILIPFLLVACFFRAICSLLEVPVQSLFLVFLILSDVMALHFFFMVKTEGSWLDIGTSLSHYVISMATTFFLMLLMQLANILTTFNFTINRNNDSLPEVLPRVAITKRRPHRD